MDKAILICGSAECLFRDLEKAQEIFNLKNELTRPTVACINHTAIYYPYFFDLWVSHHPELFQELHHYIKGSISLYTDTTDRRVDRVFTFKDFLCTDSGLLAVKIALEIGFNKIMLAGVPLDNSPKFYSPSEPSQWASDNIQAEWAKATAGSESKIRSFSGKTAERFGIPTREWLND